MENKIGPKKFLIKLEWIFEFEFQQNHLSFQNSSWNETFPHFIQSSIKEDGMDGTN